MQQTQGRLADGLTGTTLVTTAVGWLDSINQLLQAFSLTVALISGVFALYFQLKRLIRERGEKRDP